MNIDFPYHVDHRRRSAATNDDDHIRDMIEQFVLTGPGERVNRPTFGAGLQQLVFAGNSPELAATLQFMIQGGLQQYFSDLIDVDAVEVEAIESTLRVTVAYVVRRTGARERTTVTSRVG
jgi:uncharacterized protein